MTTKILVVAPAWVGDLVMANSLLQLLKMQQPAAIIHVLAAPFLEPLLTRMPEVNKIIAAPFKHGELNLTARYQLAKSLHSENYTQAIVLPNSFKSALIPFWAKIPHRTGWRGEMRYFLLNDLRILNAQLLPLMVQRFVALGLPKNAVLSEDYPLPKLTITTVANTLQKLQLTMPTKPVLAFCPGAEYGAAKRWPAEYFATVAKAKIKAGYAVWIFGGVKDQAIATAIQQQCDNACVDLTGKTDLGEAADLLSLASVIVTNDTGLMHVAAAVDRPIIAIFGSSSPKFTPPLTKNATIVSLNLDCSPCFKRECPLGHLQCLRDIRPEKISALI